MNHNLTAATQRSELTRQINARTNPYAAIEAREAMAEGLRQQEYRITMRWQPGPVQLGARV